MPLSRWPEIAGGNILRLKRPLRVAGRLCSLAIMAAAPADPDDAAAEASVYLYDDAGRLLLDDAGRPEPVLIRLRGLVLVRAGGTVLPGGHDYFPDCGRCGGLGLADGRPVRVCLACAGRGFQRRFRRLHPEVIG